MGRKSNIPPQKIDRSNQTVEQLLAAGVEAFVKYGPEGVTTRELAKAAGVNVAAIGYYFGGKEGYYLAVVGHLIKEHAQAVHSLISEVSEALQRSDKTSQTAGALLGKFIKDLTTIIVLNPTTKKVASISSRENLHPTSAFELVYQYLLLPLHSTISELVGCATGTPASSPVTIIRSHVLLGQVLYFSVAGSTLRRRLGWKKISKKQAELIAETVTETAIRAIGMDNKDLA